MIVSLTLNPSLDRAVEVEQLVPGTVIRARRATLDPGGKGVNVSRALLAASVPSRAVLPVGGPQGDQLVRLLRAEGVDVVAVQIRGGTRSNITLAEPDGAITKINEPGPTLSADELDAITEAVLAATHAADWVAACGSLPPGVTDDYYARLCRRLVSAGIRVAVDTSGPALLAAVAAGPTVVKPNREELAEAVDAPLRSVGEAVEAAQVLRSKGARDVLVSLGSDGALLVSEDGVVSGDAHVAGPRSTVGAGDALLAGYLAAGAEGPEALAEGLAWAAAAVAQPGSRMPAPDQIRRSAVRLHDRTNLSRPLVSSG
ncbi:MAG TPA: 1-phosphofructokinase [Actinomycetes bacterium]